MEIKYEACSDWAVLKIKVYAKHRAILFVQVSRRVVKRTSRNNKVLIDSYLPIVKALVEGKGCSRGPLHPEIVKFCKVSLTALVFSEGGWVGVEL